MNIEFVNNFVRKSPHLFEILDIQRFRLKFRLQTRDTAKKFYNSYGSSVWTLIPGKVLDLGLLSHHNGRNI